MLTASSLGDVPEQRRDARSVRPDTQTEGWTVGVQLAVLETSASGSSSLPSTQSGTR